MKQNLSNSAMVIMVLLYLLDVLTPVSFIGAASAAAAVVLATNLPFMGKSFRLPAWIFCFVGAFILIWECAPVSQWLSGLSSMMNTAVILIVMQSLALAMHQGGYEQAVSDCLRNGTRSTTGLFCVIMLLTHLLAGVMSLGCVVVVLAAIVPALDGKISERNRFIASSVCCGYCTLFLWAPGTATVLMSTQIFNLSWREYFPYAFALSVLGLGLGAALALIRFQNRALTVTETERAPAAVPSKTAMGKVKRLILVLLLIVVGITLLEQIELSTPTGRLLITTLVISAIWILGQGKHPQPVFQSWWKDYLPQSGDLSAFFLAMGIFSAAIQYSGFSDALTAFCEKYQSLLGLLVLPLLPIILVLFSLVGVHPFVSVLMVGPVLARMTLPATPLQLGLAMSLGCCLSYMLSPFSGVILALSAGLEEIPARICFRANFAYALVYYILAIFVIVLFPCLL